MLKEKGFIILKYILLICVGLVFSRYYFRFAFYIIHFISLDNTSENTLLLGTVIIYIAFIFPLILILLKNISHFIASKK